MKSKGNTAWKLVEIGLGPLPPSLVILPLVVGGLVGNVIVLFTIVANPDLAGGQRMATSAHVLWQLASGLSVVTALCALWIVVLMDARAIRAKRSFFAGVLAALFVGAIQAGRWLLVVLSGDYPLSTRLLWISLTVGPLFVAGSRIVRMLRTRAD